MIVLAVETITRRGSIALWRDGRSVGRIGQSTLTHGQRLPNEVLEWLAGLELTLRDVDLFAVVVGPGSFTGLRVGISTVQGFSLPAGRQVVPVPTLEALAEAFLAGASPWHGVLVPCLDGQRGEVFACAYGVSGEPNIDGCPLEQPAAVGRPAAELDRIGPTAANRPVAFVGDGASRYAAELQAAMPEAACTTPGMSMAEAAARVAARRPSSAVAPHALRPVYIRRPDVLLARDRARARATERATTSSGLTVRAATEGDFPGVAALQRSIFLNPWGIDAIRWELENTDVARLYVAETAAGELLAYCTCWIVFDELHINGLAVAEASRRRGVARELLAGVFRDAVGHGARSATLEVRQSNEAARGLYEGLGFSVEGRRRDYYQHPREDALILWHRHLAAASTLW